MSIDPLLVISVIIALGAISKLIAAQYRVPNVVFLLAFGVLIGPEGVGILSTLISSSQLSLIVGFAVAIIVFEGAFSLTLTQIRATSRPTFYLVTIGSAITFVVLGLIIRLLLGLQWSLSFLISALLIATGPTVITPILEHIRVSERVSSILETEGIINDPVASVLGAVIFSAILSLRRTGGSQNFVVDFVVRISVGTLIGIVTALVLAYVLRRFSRSPEDSHIVVLATAVLSYAIATQFADEAGVVAVAVAGLAMGNSDIPFQEEIAGFSSVVSSIVLSAVYIVLAALIQFDEILSLGFGGLVIVLLAMFAVRPLSVFISTYGSEFSRNERLFVSAVGPRGIIPAATATLFSLKLSTAGVANATSVVSLVFLVILVTIVTEAGGAPFIARALDIEPMTTLIIGGSETGQLLADELESRGGNPVIVEQDTGTVRTLQAAAYSVVQGDGTNDDVLAKAGADNARMVVATTSDDAVNILACQTARTKFGIEKLVSLVNDPTKSEAFQDLGVSTITPTKATVSSIAELVTLPSLFEWRESVSHTQNATQETVTSNDVDGKRIGDIELPDQCLLVLLQRGTEYIVPTPDVVLEGGDQVVLLGQTDAVETATGLFTGEP